MNQGAREGPFLRPGSSLSRSKGLPYNSAVKRERALLERRYKGLIRERLDMSRLVSQVGNRKVPFLRLFKYKEAFSFQLVLDLLDGFCASPGGDYLLDPFCGMGTSCFAAGTRAIASVGVDRLPVAAFSARCLSLFARAEPDQLRRALGEARSNLRAVEPAHVARDIRIMPLAFPPKVINDLRKWKAGIERLADPEREMMLFLFLSILEECSYTSKDGQFLRLKTGKRLPPVAEALGRRVEMAEEDLAETRAMPGFGKDFVAGKIYEGDARNMDGIPLDRPPSLLVTSPPYANRYDYSRSYALELAFGFVRDFSEIRELRHSLLRSHIESRRHEGDEPPHPVVAEVLAALANKHLNNPKIPDMLLGYFVDMGLVLDEWARILARGAHVAMVVDNVRFEGEMVPVDLVLSDMARARGFSVEEILVARYKGNSSQQMGRYGREPVRESVVIWRKGSRSRRGGLSLSHPSASR